MQQEALHEIWSVIETRLQQFRQLDLENIDSENGEVVVRQSMEMCQWVLVLEPYVPGADILLESLIQVSNALLSEVEHSDRSRSRGRPCVDISDEQLLFFIQHSFKITDIAHLFGCSRRTVERRM